MQKLTFILLLIVLSISAGCSDNRSQYIVSDGFAQGSTYHIVYKLPLTENADSTQNAIEKIFKECFESVNKSLSGYDSLSIISKVNRNERVYLDSIFVEIYRFAMDFYEISGGMVDVTSAPLFDVWGFGFSNKERVDSRMIDSVKAFVGPDMFTLRKDGNGYYLTKKDMRAKLNFNAIAPGYTADYIARRLEEASITDYIVEVGGEIFCNGKNANGGEWRVGIDKPIDGNYLPGNDLASIIELSGKGLVTSGNYRKFYIEDGEKHSHTINPESGYPVKHNLLSATVIAENATLADAYATFFMVIGLERAKSYLDEHPELDAQLIYSQDQELKTYSTKGIKETK